MNPNPRSATSFLMVPDIWCEPPFPNVLPRAVEACSSGAHGERTPSGCARRLPSAQAVQTPTLASPARGGGKKARTLPPTRGREMVLGERLDDHHEDDGEGDHPADDAVDPRLPRQLLVGRRSLARRLERLDLPRRHPRVEPPGDHDQDHEKNQAGDNPAP